MNAERPRVVYLVGAGASHGSVQSVGCNRGILMADLRLPLANAVHDLVRSKPRKYGNLRTLVNNFIHEGVDFEHIITFLDESPSITHRQFADELRNIFAKVLKRQFREIERDIGKERFGLYSALLDMYEVDGCPEALRGILSINYDEYIEEAARSVRGEAVDYGLAGDKVEDGSHPLILLKLHGSFNWKDVWPIEMGRKATTKSLWIPPGIQKGKNRYPFNILWGRARDLLDCDILRVIGCRLSGNDWDLISLLFSTRNTHGGGRSPYVIEIIDAPTRAFRLKDEYPYLEMRSIFELQEQEVGQHFISEFLGGSPRSYDDLDADDLNLARTRSYEGINWFRLWMEQKAEAFERDLNINSTETETGEFRRLLQEV